MRTGTDALRSLHRFVWKALENDPPQVWEDIERGWEIRLWGTEGEFAFPFARVAAITAMDLSGSAFVREAARGFAVHAYPVPKLTPEDSIIEVERVEELLVQAFEQGITYTEPLLAPLVFVLVGVTAGAGGGLAAGVYEYAVTSVNATGESALAEWLDVDVLADGSTVTVDWSPAVDADSYNLYRIGPGSTPPVLVASDIVGLEYADVGASVGPQVPPAESAALATISTGPHRIPLYDYDGVPLDGPNSISYARFPADFLRVQQAPINRITDPEDDRFWLITVEPRLTWRRGGRRIGGTKIVKQVKLVENPS